LENLEKLGHVALFSAEAILLVVLFWACDAALRPDEVRVVNDTNRSVTLRNCQYALGATSPVVVEPGETTSINALNACQVHAPAYVGCLPFPAEVYETAETVRVSRMNTLVPAPICAATDARERPRDYLPGGN